MRIVVLGATGHTGRMVVRALREREVDVVACGRDQTALDRLKGIGVETRVVDARRRDAVRDALTGVDGVANLAGPFLDTGHLPIEEAIRQGVPYVDTTGEQAFMYEVRSRHGQAAKAEGVAIVNALAYEYAFADLATRAHLPEGGDALHVLYRSRRAQGSAGTKKSIVRVLAAPALGHENGKLEPDNPGAHTHRFPTLDGWRDGISFAGGEILTIPSHTPFRTIRTYVPGPPTRAKQVRMAAPAARLLLRGPVLKLAETLIEQRHTPPSNEEARGEIYLMATRGDETRALLVRTPDPYLATAEACAEGIVRLARGPRTGGILAPAEAFDADDMLAALHARMPGFGVERLVVLPNGVAQTAAADDKPK